MKKMLVVPVMALLLMSSLLAGVMTARDITPKDIAHPMPIIERENQPTSEANCESETGSRSSDILEEMKLKK